MTATLIPPPPRASAPAAATRRATAVVQHAPAKPVRTRPRPERDRFVDAVRAVGTVGVVLLHWLMAEAAWDGQTLHVGNAIGHGSAWVLTWGLQVLPLLFFAAGASAAYQSQRLPAGGRRWGSVLGGRLRGIARPVGAFVGAWVVAVAALLAVGVPDDAVWRLARMAPQLLWFLGVWVVLVALTPVLVTAWRRWGVRALAAAVVAPLVVDLVRFGAGVGDAAWANVLLVWALPFLAGIAYAERRAGARSMPGRRPVGDGLPRPAALVLTAVVAVAAMAALVTFGPYPPSMVGMPGDAISNLAPPTAPIVAQAVAQVALVIAARSAIARWADGRGRRVVDGLARWSMTVYLWHLTAMFAVVGTVLLVLDERLPVAWSADWWATRPVWFAAFGLVLLALVRVFGRFEVVPRVSPRGRALSAAGPARTASSPRGR